MTEIDLSSQSLLNEVKVSTHHHHLKQMELLLVAIPFK